MSGQKRGQLFPGEELRASDLNIFSKSHSSDLEKETGRWFLSWIKILLMNI